MIDTSPKDVVASVGELKNCHFSSSWQPIRVGLAKGNWSVNDYRAVCQKLAAAAPSSARQNECHIIMNSFNYRRVQQKTNDAATHKKTPEKKTRYCHNIISITSLYQARLVCKMKL
jgi:hypothetical protein